LIGSHDRRYWNDRDRAAFEDFHLFPGFGVGPVPLAFVGPPISMKRSGVMTGGIGTIGTGGF
jgi:hypothetical protein